MLRETMIVLATAAALTGGLTAEAFTRAAGHGGPFGEFTVQSIGHPDARSQPATESHGGNAARFRKPHNGRTRSSRSHRPQSLRPLSFPPNLCWTDNAGSNVFKCEALIVLSIALKIAKDASHIAKE
jgi:hypothetical protein